MTNRAIQVLMTLATAASLAACSKLAARKYIVPTVLDAPSEMQVTRMTPQEVEVSWQAASVKRGAGSLAFYEILRDGQVIGTVSYTQRSYVDQTVWPLTPYQYQVRAVSTDGVYSDASSTLSVTSLSDYLLDENGGFILDQNGNRIIAR